jgi:hypothetical protein
MNVFQILVVTISGLTLLGSIITVYVKLKIEIAKIEVHILNIQRELNAKEVSLLRLEDKNSDAHKDILLKVDRILETIKK